MAEKIGQLSIALTPDGMVRLSMAGNSSCWSKVLVALFERNANTRTVPGAEAALIPWRDFAPLMGQLHTVLKVNGNPTVSADATTEMLIKRGREATRALDNAANIQPIAEDALLTVLDAHAFGSGETPRRPLSDEQKRNVRKLASLPNGATFSVPGAGKTTEALALYTYKSGLQQQLLVVCPKNAFAAWEEQVQICLPTLRPVRLVGGYTAIAAILKRQPTVVLVTYTQAVIVRDLLARYMTEKPTAMILDESHKIKRGEQGAWGTAALDLSHLPEWKLIMSGTPMPNEFGDLEPQMKFLFPLAPWNFDAQETVLPLIRNVYVRTTKAELNLPPVYRTATPLPMTEGQSRIYNLCASRLARDLEAGLKSGDKNALRRIGQGYMLLLQLASNPALLARHAAGFSSGDLAECLTSESPKVAYACMRARQLAAENRKCIIWSGFVENVTVIAERLADIGADYIYGGVASGDENEDGTRENKILRFHEDDSAMVLVANPAACSEGISLHRVCHYALYVDRNYNAAQYLQSSDRIHRLGLPPGTRTDIELIYHPGSIDDSVNRRLDDKISLMQNTLNDYSIHVETLWQDVDDVLDADDIADLLRTLKGNA